MNPWIGRGLLLAALVASIAIRAPHDGRSSKTPVAESRRGRLEVTLIALMLLGTMLLPLVAIATPLLSFAEYPLHPVALGLGVVLMTIGLWLFHRSHADLGTNWSVTLEVREGHRLVTEGIYRYVRHPMYTALYCYALGQALLLPNWIAGPACFQAFTLMFLFRLGPEEQMMLEKFGPEYEAYRARTKRLVPFIW